MKHFTFHKNHGRLTVLLTVLTVFAVLLSACGGSAPRESAAKSEGYYYANGQSAASGGSAYAEDMAAESKDGGWYEAESPAENSGKIQSGADGRFDPENVKLIYTAYLSLQSTDFDAAEKALQQIVAQYGGYIQDSNRYYGSYFSKNTNRSASYTVRVPSEHYSELLSAVGDSCHVVNFNENIQDVGLVYADTENRLATLTTKHERLLDLLSKAEKMEDIISLENALADCEYQIDNYSSTLKRYDSLVSFSTVNIDLQEVEQLSQAITEPPGFFTRLGRAFKRGFVNFTYTLEDLAMWLSSNIIGIAIFIVVVIVAVKLIKKFTRRRKDLAREAKKAAAEQKSEGGEQK